MLPLYPRSLQSIIHRRIILVENTIKSGVQANPCKMVVINNNTIFRCSYKSCRCVVRRFVAVASCRVALLRVYSGTYDDKCTRTYCARAVWCVLYAYKPTNPCPGFGRGYLFTELRYLGELMMYLEFTTVFIVTFVMGVRFTLISEIRFGFYYLFRER